MSDASEDVLRVERLAEHFGTPLYVYDCARVDRAIADLAAALPKGIDVFYSLKANPHPVLVRRLVLGGCGAEVSSEGELAAALTAGVEAQRCIYTGPSKTPTELAHAIACGVVRFSIESAIDFSRVASAAAEAGTAVDCLLRVNVGAAAGGGLRMSGPSQFGIDEETLLAAPEHYRPRPFVSIVGLHYFAATNVLDEDELFAQVEAHVDSALRVSDDLGIEVRILDLGGGFGAPFARAGTRPRYASLRERLSELFDSRLSGWRDQRPAILFESGRYLVGDSGWLACRVNDVKTSGGRTILITDSGIHHLGGMAGLRRVPPLVPSLLGSAVSEEPDDVVDIVGSLCTPLDRWAAGARLSGVAVGDVLVLPNVGAYGLSASLLAFLSRAAPVEVVVDGDEVLSCTQLSVTRTDVRAEPVTGSRGSPTISSGRAH